MEFTNNQVTFLNEVEQILRDSNIDMAAGYYELIKNNIGFVTDDTDVYEVYYMPPAEEDYYSNGEIIVGNYKIELNELSVPTGYCECSPEDEGFNPKYNCCGDRGCDYYTPSIKIIRQETIVNESLNVQEKELWKMDEEWNKVTETMKEKLYKEQMIEYYEKEMKRIKENLDNIKNGDKNEEK